MCAIEVQILEVMNQESEPFKDAFHCSPIPQAILSRDFEIKEWNAVFERTVGPMRLGSLLSEFVDKTSHDDLDALLRSACLREPTGNAASVPIHSQIVGGNGMVLTVSPLAPRDSDVLLLVTLQAVQSTDALDAMRRETLELERVVAERTEALQRTNKELEMFSYSVSHDLRSPLRTVLGFAAALEEDFAETIGEEGIEHIARISAAARRMDELISAILAVSRISKAPIQRVDVDLTELAENLLPELKRSWPSTEFALEPGLVVNADPALLRVVVANLLDNACKFASKSEKPLVELGRAQDLPEKPIFVRDNGIGFEQEYAQKIFEPFERLHPVAKYPGTGIGLSNVLRVIDRHKGRVWAVGNLGHGATFYFTLKS